MKKAFYFLIICCYARDIVYPAPSKTVHTVAEKAFHGTNTQEIVRIFEHTIPTLPQQVQQSEAFTILAQYEEHAGLSSAAALHYQKAAALSNTAKSELLLAAVRSFLQAGASNAARELLSRIPDCLSGNIHNPAYRKGAVYEAWLLLAENHIDAALQLVQRYISSGLFTDYEPALLFTLWWVDNDTAAKTALLTQYPDSLETAVVRGTVTILPVAFWYLMPRKQTTLSTQHTSKNIANTTTSKTVKVLQKNEEKAVKPLYYQLGFYKTKKYADALIKNLEKDGFVARMKTEKRSSGTTYYIVFVEETHTGTIGIRLKDAEYEACPVFSK